MQKLTIFFFSLLLVLSPLSVRSESNPFAKSTENTIDTSVIWQFKNGEAVKTAKDNKDADTHYNLVFDGRVLRLILSAGSIDDPANAKHYEQFAIEDVMIDAKRLPLFQWCLSNQERHARFLQQGLPVEKNICENQGGNGTFVMMLNQDTLDALEAGKTLTFVIKPFRTSIVINYALADFSKMVATLANKRAPPKAAEKPPAPAARLAESCVVKPPAGFESIKAMEYNCNSVVEETEANNKMILLVSKERKKIEAEKESKRQGEAASKKKSDDERLKLEQDKLAEAAAIAASKLKQEELNAEITTKMMGVCTKMWDKGEHRCYCEKYIDQAPDNIKALSKCQ